MKLLTKYEMFGLIIIGAICLLAVAVIFAGDKTKSPASELRWACSKVSGDEDIKVCFLKDFKTICYILDNRVGLSCVKYD